MQLHERPKSKAEEAAKPTKFVGTDGCSRPHSAPCRAHRLLRRRTRRSHRIQRRRFNHRATTSNWPIPTSIADRFRRIPNSVIL